jgi:hypothetical protein
MPSSLIQLAQGELRQRVDKATDLSFFRNSGLLDFPEADPSAEVVDYGKKGKASRCFAPPFSPTIIEERSARPEHQLSLLTGTQSE